MKAYELKQIEDYINQRHHNRIFAPEETANGYWSTYVSDTTKTRNRRKITRKKKEDLYLALYEYYRGDAAPSKEQPESITLKQLYPEWLEKKRMETTAENYIRRINGDWKRYYEDDEIVYKDIADITKDDIQRWLLILAKGRGHGIPKTQFYNASMILRQMMEYAVELGIIQHNPFNDAKVDLRKFLRPRRKKPDTEEVFTNAEISEIKRLCWETYKSGDYHIRHHLAPLAILFQLQTGLRIGELCALRWEDVSENYLYVRRMYRYETREVVPHGKTSTASRQLPLTREAHEILDECRAYQVRNHISQVGYIFSETSAPLPPPSVNKLMRKVCEQIGGKLRNSHKIRKTVISALIDENINIDTVRRLSGHADSKITLDAYVYDRDIDSDKLSKISKALNFDASE